MNKIGLLLRSLHDAETDLAAEYRAVAERQAAQQDVYYMSHSLAKECDEHARRLTEIGRRYDADLPGPSQDSMLDNVLATVRHKTSELLGRRPESGLLLLRDLRALYLMAAEADIHWVTLGQVAQAMRDQELLDDVTTLHKQTLTQMKWLKTKLREASPQVLCV